MVSERDSLKRRSDALEKEILRRSSATTPAPPTCPACPTLPPVAAPLPTSEASAAPATPAPTVAAQQHAIQTPLQLYGHKVFNNVSARLATGRTGYSVHIISHSHWDREWYRPLEAFARLMVTVVDGVVSHLQRPETGIEHFHWDSQAVLVQDYLAARPESRVSVCLFVSGRVTQSHCASHSN